MDSIAVADGKVNWKLLVSNAPQQKLKDTFLLAELPVLAPLRHSPSSVTRGCCERGSEHTSYSVCIMGVLFTCSKVELESSLCLHCAFTFLCVLPPWAKFHRELGQVMKEKFMGECEPASLPVPLSCLL